MNIKNKVAIITGGLSGMGEACATLLKTKGAKVIVLDISPTPSKNCMCVDVSREEDVQYAINQIVQKFKKIDILINCAGIARASRMVNKTSTLPLEDFSKVINVNLLGTFNVMKEVANVMIKNEDEERGVIINTASVAAFEGQIGQTAYSASKGGIVAMTLPAARELAQFGIRVNTIAPGLIATPLLLNLPQEVQKSLASSVVFPKRLGQVEEFANLALHIITNTYINGETIRLDGALRMQAR